MGGIILEFILNKYDGMVQNRLTAFT